MIERTNSWHTRGFRRLQVCTEVRTRVIEALIALANTIITIRNLIHHAWTTHRWDQRPPHTSPNLLTQSLRCSVDIDRELSFCYSPHR